MQKEHAIGEALRKAHVMRNDDAGEMKLALQLLNNVAEQMRNERAAGLRRVYIGELLKEHPPVLNEFALSNLVNEQPAAPAK